MIKQLRLVELESETNSPSRSSKYNFHSLLFKIHVRMFEFSFTGNNRTQVHIQSRYKRPPFVVCLFHCYKLTRILNVQWLVVLHREWVNDRATLINSKFLKISAFFPSTARFTSCATSSRCAGVHPACSFLMSGIAFVVGGTRFDANWVWFHNVKFQFS